jgi:3-hydroxymyristoyl/3-hydroxydecanoyl-(acyl carrier protein) dehydratase
MDKVNPRKPLLSLDQLSDQFLELNPAELLPHGPGFLFLSSPASYYQNQSLLVSHQKITAQEFWVKDHFPGAPVFPGVLQVEMMGQLALIYAFHQMSEEEAEVGVRLTGVDQTHFFRELKIDDAIQVLARIEECDSFQLKATCQILTGGCVASFCQIKAVFVE